MARQRGPLQLTGSIGNLSFYYHKDYGYLARQKGERSGKVSPRTRENGDELGSASRTGKLIRLGIKAALGLQGDSTVSQRLTGCLYRLLQYDTVSARGERQVAAGLASEAGRQLLRSFAFVKHSPPDRILPVPSVYSEEDNGLMLSNFLPQRDLVWPKGATHVQLQSGVIFVDPERNAYRAYGTAVQVLRADADAWDVKLGFGQVSEGNGFRVCVIGVVFLAETNGELISLKSGVCIV